ncbi:ABC-type nitrate/sulfonate/bicarbonate transport system, ATPase component [Dehalogenimonas alkenigignens]|uniref:ABC-type nitrate/sulfonate/bicarbonate transport system, ATPase component n=1 Tax=Dehalogenimonas alkenigignens TaxID=1217799 RepID=A0A0W0GL66_9CHLR|nr:ABC transporter ATP-binding protein [Dehalogenimonas alkenigignens]KTB49300.1 ABC-type nitrate/sulfonate/bicarbonate transport system, ATPase component [Dehalogenimonas alkenigignens]
MSNINFEHISKSFTGAGLVLDDFNVTVPSGSFVSLVGPTACGKSTLLRLILGLDQPDEGRIHLESKNNDCAVPCAIAFQEPRLLPWLTVRENIELVLEGHCPDGAGRAAELLGMVGLADFANAYPKVLSGGMAQRVSLARALALEPDVLLLDEPFSAVDALTRMKLQDALIRIYMARPRTTLMVTHDIDEALLTSQKIIVLSCRPASIVDVVEVKAGYPRDRTDTNLFALKTRILKGLGIVAEDILEGAGI